MQPAEKEQIDRELVSAIETYIQRMGWADPNYTLTDVVVVTMRRGWDQTGGKAATSVITPTDTPVPTALGLAQAVAAKFQEQMVRSLDPNRKADE